jgi:phage terminase large subunit-like protein
MNWNMLSLGLRVGKDPRGVVTTTPKVTALMKELLAAETTATTHSTSYENRRHLAPQFFDTIIRRFEGTSLGESELLGKLVEHSEAQWFTRFNRARHVSETAELNQNLPAYLAVDCGVSRFTGAVLYQWIPLDHERARLHIVADYLAENRLHAENAEALLALAARQVFGNSIIVAVGPIRKRAPFPII